jgi:hypothetical protein
VCDLVRGERDGEAPLPGRRVRGLRGLERGVRPLRAIRPRCGVAERAEVLIFFSLVKRQSAETSSTTAGVGAQPRSPRRRKAMRTGLLLF